MTGNPRPRWILPWPLQAVAWLGLVAAYAALAELSFQSASVHPVVASVWPPAGLALAVLVLLGLRHWPGVFAGALLANLLNGVPWPAAAVIATGNTAAALAGAYALRQLGFQVQLHRVRDALVLLGFGALLSPAIAATAGTFGLDLASDAPVEHLTTIWLTWWSGDAIGVVLLAPLMLAWRDGRLPELTWRGVGEIVLLGAGLLAASVLLMRVPQGYEYAVFPLVGWAAIRGGLKGASTATAMVAIVAIWYAAHGAGPFAETAGGGMWRLQLFLALLAAKSLVLTSMAQSQAAAASALKNTELRFRRIFEHSAVGIAVVQPAGGLTDTNPAFREMLGYSSAELACRDVSDITHPDDMAAEQALLQEVLEGKRTTYCMVKRYLRKDGSVVWGRLTAMQVPQDEDGPGSVGVGMVEDISEQRAAEEALERDAAERRESAENLRRTTETLQTLIDASPLAIMTLDPEGRLRSWNQAAEGMFGWSAAEAVGHPPPFIPAEALEQFRKSVGRVLAGEAITGLQAQRRRRDGRSMDIRICAAPTKDPHGVIDGVIALIEDVTDRKSLGEQLRQAQKMEAIGQLTGGLAHDFNNLLTIVITNAALLADEIGPDRIEMRAELSELQRAAVRGVELVRKLMAFSRRRSVELQPLNLGQVVSDASSDLRRLLPASVEVGVQVEDRAPLTVTGDVGAIEQMIFNLATNARDAMPDGGSLRLSVYRALLDVEHRRTHGWGTPGAYVVLSVSDTGCGMSPKVRARAFEPFFTTKEVGKGTGLGMAMVYGLVSQHKGYADLESTEGRGTTVRLYFPAVTAEVRSSSETGRSVMPAGGTERILVVDDEEGIRRSAVRVLSKFGYQVDEAADGESAMAALRSAKAPFNLVLADLVMPRMGGIALYQELRREGSEVRVLLMSGHTADDLDPSDDPILRARFLHKPWTITDLLRRVREVLDAAA